MTSNKNTDKLPEIKRDAPLKSRLISITLIGFDDVFGKIGALYFRLLCRLIDKAAKDYSLVKNLIEKEIKSNDKLNYRLPIVDHLEDCFSSVNRIIRIIRMLEKGIIKKKSIGYCPVCNQKIEEISTILNKCDFLKFSKLKAYKKIQSQSISKIRNRIEHIDEDIYLGKINGSIFIDIDENYKNITLNGINCSFSQLVSIIESHHEFMLEIISNLPKKGKGGEFYDENDKKWKQPR